MKERKKERARERNALVVTSASTSNDDSMVVVVGSFKALPALREKETENKKSKLSFS